MRKYGIFLFVLLIIGNMRVGVRAQDSFSAMTGNATYGGLSAGSPGAANVNIFFNPYMGQNGTLGLGLSISLLTVLMNGQDESEKNATDDDLYTAAQLSIPWYLVNRENIFLAVSPLAGFGYYHPGGKAKGHWAYAGGAVDLYLWGFFAECGAGYGPRHGIAGVKIANNTSLLLSVGFLGKGVSW